MVVAFFGHSDTLSEVYPLIEHEIAKLAEQNDELICYVGTHGAFDRMAQRALKQVVDKYPHISAYIVLAYYEPSPKEEREQYKLPTIYPEGIENAPKRFAIDYRNKFMVNVCDTVICYVWHIGDGARKFVEMAERKKKRIINLADKTRQD